jgi:phosphate/phosphite/phosphonate ABC transporter binding protein
MSIPSLTFTSCQAPSADLFCEAVAGFIGRRIGVRTEFVTNCPWKERERAFDRGEIAVCWMCGWPYAERADTSGADVELIAAPVMADSRYLGRSVYFSDIVVRADSRFRSFDDLCGASWAYNEPKSHSGYNVVRYYLAGRNIDGAFFGSVVESGSHAASIDLILGGTVDASAIDSTVLEAVGRYRPEIVPLLRVIGTIGPSPAPPWVMRSSLSPSVRDALRREFLTMHESLAGRALLANAAVRRFAPVTNDDYNPIREMAALAASVRL